ncbi:thioesterase family protein [Actinomadura fibrosa]|uniref:Thioesterase family protein n=1 Tax=Actinomadura fibrosa TaxID=111802 RepID=A0ABW2XU84_9ACTN|nr:thioesterase family protein [Actinomadura fibrosa]
MADLAGDTQVTGGPGTWSAKVSGEWDLWGPNGGYLATIALRAAGEHAPGLRPASLECHFLRSPAPGGAELTTVSLRVTGRAHSVRVSMAQDGSPVLEALVWLVEPGLDGLPQRSVAPPAGPPPDGLASYEELLPPAHKYREPFWQHVEERPLNQTRHLIWPEDPSEDSVRTSWLRFRPEPCFTDPCLDAGRSVIAADVFPFLAAVIALEPGPLTHIAPTISLSVSFHALRPDSEWLLVHTESPAAGDGLLAGRTSIWALNGDLVASSRVQMMCRSLRPRGS